MISLISALLEPFPGSKKKNQDGFFWISVSVQSVCAVTGSEKEDREKYRCNRGLREFGIGRERRGTSCVHGGGVGEFYGGEAFPALESSCLWNIKERERRTDICTTHNFSLRIVLLALLVLIRVFKTK